ncbi:hypothetical protein Ddc_11545 [Ditylenchus destructor]|nr:hypothetical protein Ddc_11545 [Ditylenchus destructor]
MAEKQAFPEDGTHIEPKAKKCRSEVKIPTITVMDNVTIVELFKYLNYVRLAKTSLISKRFRDLIQTHRHSLALLPAGKISMQIVPGPARNYEFFPVFEFPSIFNNDPATIKVFNKELSGDAYNDWVTRNQYCKQIPVQGQDGGEQSTQNHGKVYQLSTATNQLETTTFFAKAELNHENWPLFQHFVRLLTAPHIYFSSVELVPDYDILNLLAGAVNQDRKRLQCETLYFSLEGNIQKFMTWIKGHVSCTEFQISDRSGFKFESELLGVYDKEFLDFFLTGADCTRKINVKYYDCTCAVVDFVQKFIDLKKSDECQMIPSIESDATFRITEMMKRNYAKFLVKEKRCEVEDFRDHWDYGIGECTYTAFDFEFINNDIGKKLELTADILDDTDRHRIGFRSSFKLKIKNL